MEAERSFINHANMHVGSKFLRGTKSEGIGDQVPKAAFRLGKTRGCCENADGLRKFGVVALAVGFDDRQNGGVGGGGWGHCLVSVRVEGVFGLMGLASRLRGGMDTTQGGFVSV